MEGPATDKHEAPTHLDSLLNKPHHPLCVCACVRACVRVCAHEADMLEGKGLIMHTIEANISFCQLY